MYRSTVVKFSISLVQMDLLRLDDQRDSPRRRSSRESSAEVLALSREEGSQQEFQKVQLRSPSLSSFLRRQYDDQEAPGLILGRIRAEYLQASHLVACRCHLPGFVQLAMQMQLESYHRP